MTLANVRKNMNGPAGPCNQEQRCSIFQKTSHKQFVIFFLPYVLIPSADSCHALFSLSFVPRNNSFKLFKTLCLVYIIYFVFRWDRIAFWYIDKRQGVRGNASHGKYEVFEGQKRCFFAFWWTVTIVLQILSLQEDSRRRVCLKEQSTMLSFQWTAFISFKNNYLKLGLSE